MDKAAGSFANYLENQLEAVREAQLHSKNMTKDFMMGKVDNLHDVMIAGEKAGLAMKTMNTLRKYLKPIARFLKLVSSLV